MKVIPIPAKVPSGERKTGYEEVFVVVTVIIILNNIEVVLQCIVINRCVYDQSIVG